MTYEEVSQELTRLATNAGEHVRLVRGEKMDGTAVHLLPVKWFIAMKVTGRLYVGTYEGSQLRIVGTKDLAFEKVTPEFLREEFNEALAEQVAHTLDPEVVKAFFSGLPLGRGALAGDTNSRF